VTETERGLALLEVVDREALVGRRDQTPFTPQVAQGGKSHRLLLRPCIAWGNGGYALTRTGDPRIMSAML
jgi:hypothetical protein